MIKIVQASVNDMQAIREVQKLTWFDTYPNEKLGITREDIEAKFAIEDPIETEKRKKMYSDPTIGVWIAKDGERVVGFCFAGKRESGNRIGAIYLLPSYQGQGVGGNLIEQALSWLGEAEDIYVNVASYNEQAMEFYKKHGFVKTGNHPNSEVADFPSGKSIPETEMVRKVK